MGISILLALLIYQIPAVNYRLSWRVDAAKAYVRNWLNPVEVPTPLPTPARVAQEQTASPTATPLPSPTFTPTPTITPGSTATPIPSPTPIPQQVLLPPPEWEKQDWNNCGPATLAMYLRAYGWEGDQYNISRLLKPERNDKNVNIEELVYYVRNRAGWLNVEFRVGGEINLLIQLLAEGIPVMVEAGEELDAAYLRNDDRWAGHYLLLTGYDNAAQTFVAQDTYYGADQTFTYAFIDEVWKAFNRVYLIVYLPHQEETVKRILGPQWDVDFNRQHALEVAQAEAEANPEDAFAWFNVGSNLVYFEKYAEAAVAYDTARTLGLPMRMFRYQFGPFIADFHAFRLDDLLALTEYALIITANSEEAMLWRGWAYYRQGDTGDALVQFRAALEVNPNYLDAQYAIDFARNNP